MRRYTRLAPFAVLLGLAIFAPFYPSSDYYVSLMVTAVIFAIAALSLDVVIGHMGLFSFGHAAFWGLGAYTSAKLTLASSVPLVLAVLCAIVLSGAVGLAVGYVVLKRNRGLELAMVTLGFGVLLATVAVRNFKITGGEAGILGIAPLSIFGREASTPIDQYFYVLVLLVMVVYGMWRTSGSRFGRAVHSLREGEHLAASIGIRVSRTYAIAFAGAAALAGFAGALYGHTLGYVSPSLFSLTFMFVFLIMVVVGGSGTLGGPILGALLYVFGTEIARSFSEESRLLIFGGILLVVAIFLPGGIYPPLKALVVRFTDPPAGPEPEPVPAATAPAGVPAGGRGS